MTVERRQATPPKSCGKVSGFDGMIVASDPSAGGMPQAIPLTARVMVMGWLTNPLFAPTSWVHLPTMVPWSAAILPVKPPLRSFAAAVKEIVSARKVTEGMLAG
jgi:hypothetical protein